MNIWIESSLLLFSSISLHFIVPNNHNHMKRYNWLVHDNHLILWNFRLQIHVQLIQLLQEQHVDTVFKEYMMIQQTTKKFLWLWKTGMWKHQKSQKIRAFLLFCYCFSVLLRLFVFVFLVMIWICLSFVVSPYSFETMRPYAVPVVI